VAPARGSGLHGSRANLGTEQTGPARRFVLPARAFD
jgi:hypothetical protein